MRKLIQWMLTLMVCTILAIAAWIYYPKFKINQMKEQAVTVASSNQQTYLDYFRSLEKENLHHLALGDSIITGIGAENEENFIDHFSKKLEDQTSKNVLTHNEGVPGITSTQLNALVQKGTFDRQMKEADLITINVGGNDILQTMEGMNYRKVFQSFDSMQSTFIQNLTDIARKIRESNQEATIIFLEMYNPLKQSHELYSVADQLLPKWNVKIYELANSLEYTLVMETTKVINSSQLQYLSPDGVHPNSLGYKALSQQMIEQLKNKPFLKAA
ncbi:GDSL-type esterase/lipase family protein [Bacillus xiapuensis]|uniref:GDSL-type esterase/lipase family protein n=1 Tax=Bacillus xiapuensis TaxID=2014075 RepID=UPI0012FE2745|nr:GDSL-type esterase/lipase family protein [Bacillus xiapuensis]